MKGFKEFLMQGNLVELATAVIIGAAFGKVVETFTGMLMGFIGKLGGQPDFSAVTLAGVNVGNFINAIISFLIVAAVIYFLVIKPITALRNRMGAAKEDAALTTEDLLVQIRDLLETRRAI